MAQTCWCLGGGHTAHPAPGLTPLAGGSVTQPGLVSSFSDMLMPKKGGC